MTANFCQGLFSQPLDEDKEFRLRWKRETKMNFNFAKKETIALLVLLNLILGLPLVLSALKQRQEIRKRAAETDLVQVSLGPIADVGLMPGDSLDLKVYLTNTNDQEKPIRAAGVTINFDTKVFTISDLVCGHEFPAKALPESGSPPSPPGFGTKGSKIYLTCFRYENGSPQEPLGLGTGETAVLGGFKATVKNNAPSGETEIGFTRTNIPDAISLANLADAGASAKYQIAGTTPGAVGLKIKVKFAGVDRQRADQAVKIKIGKGEDFLKEIDSINVAANNQGVFENDPVILPSTITPGPNYYFLVKGPKHLQAKYCRASGQTSDGCTNGQITLREDANNLNFSSLPLLVGDLPHPLYDQDGTVNAFDAVLLVGCFETPESQNCLDWADLNFDGILNSADMNLMNLTIIGERWDDEN